MMTRATVGNGLAALLGALLMLVTTLAPPPALAQARGGGGTVREIVVTGNQRIEAATVASYLALGVGDPITAEALNDSVRRLFDTGLFRDAAVTAEGGRLLVRVAETPSINRVVFEGNDTLTDEELLALVSSRPRRAFTRSRAEADAQIIVDNFRRTGRFGATVEPVIIELPDNRVDLVFEIEEGRVTGVNSISFVGNETFSDRRLRRVIDTTESNIFDFLIASDIYDPDRLEFDRELLRRFYLSRGFADFQVLSAVAELSPDREGFFITFTISEGEVYTFAEQTVTTTDPALDPAEFEALIEGAPGDTYNAELVEQNIDRMIFLAGEKGFAFIEVNPRPVRDEAGRTIGIVYELVEGPRVYVERIDIEGNTRTLDRVIRRQFRIVEGDAFNSRELDGARRRIRGLGYFSRVEVTNEPGSADDRTVVRVNVQEQSTGSFTVGLGFSSADGILAEISLSERNFLGRGQFFRARTILAGEQQLVDFAFREPALLDRDLEAGFNLFYRQVDRSDESSFEETNYGFIPSVEFPLSESGRLRLNYQISSDEIRDVSENASPFIKADEGTALTSAVGYEYIYDKRNDPVEPTDGYVLRAGQDFAGLGGDTQYVRSSGLAKGYTSFFDEDVVASLEVEAGNITGLADEDVRITDRWFLGGDRFRGFETGGLGPRDLNTDDSLGGNNFAMLRAEVTFPIGLPEEWGFAGGVFSDVGTVWGLDPTTIGTTTVDADFELRASAGVSLFWSSGFGPLRVNLAYPFLKEDFDEEEIFRLTAGTRF